MVSTTASSRYDHLPVADISVAVPSLVAGTLRMAGVLPRFVSTPLIPLVDAQGKLVRVLHVSESLQEEGLVLESTEFPAGALDTSSLLYLYDTDTIQCARECFSRATGVGDELIPIVTQDNVYTGRCASRSQLLRMLNLGQAWPPRIGGMATPLGVYMTSGVHVGGSGVKGLISAGVLFAFLLFALKWLFLTVWVVALMAVPYLKELSARNEFISMLAEMMFVLGSVLVSLRLTPMAGLHAAEHMTINAVEQGVPLEPEAVKYMSRLHIRCGTNLMALMGGVEIGLLSLEGLRPYLNVVGELLYMVLCLLLAAMFWRRVGFWIQEHFSTRPPSLPELESGIRAAKEVLAKYELKPHTEINFFRRLWASGLFHLMATVILVNWLLEWAQDFFLSLG